MVADGTADEECCEVVVTADDAGWLAGFTRTLVEERLAACGHLVEPVRSIYRWQGELHDDARGAGGAAHPAVAGAGDRGPHRRAAPLRRALRARAARSSAATPTTWPGCVAETREADRRTQSPSVSVTMRMAADARPHREVGHATGTGTDGRAAARASGTGGRCHLQGAPRAARCDGGREGHAGTSAGLELPADVRRGDADAARELARRRAGRGGARRAAAAHPAARRRRHGCCWPTPPGPRAVAPHRRRRASASDVGDDYFAMARRVSDPRVGRGAGDLAAGALPRRARARSPSTIALSSAGGARWFHLQASRVDQAGQVVVTHTDITDRVRAERTSAWQAQARPPHRAAQPGPPARAHRRRPAAPRPRRR